MAEEYVAPTPEQWTRLMRMLQAFELGLLNLDQGAGQATRQRYGVLLVKGTETVAAGTSGDFTVYSGETKGSEAATSVTISGYVRAVAYSANTWAYAQPVDRGWEVVPAECT